MQKHAVIIETTIKSNEAVLLIRMNATLQGRRCVLKDCCAVADNAVLPPETVVPPFTLYAGSPGNIISCLYPGN